MRRYRATQHRRGISSRLQPSAFDKSGQTVVDNGHTLFSQQTSLRDSGHIGAGRKQTEDGELPLKGNRLQRRWFRFFPRRIRSPRHRISLVLRHGIEVLVYVYQ